MKTIGVLGGLGPQATMDFEARVHRIAQSLIPPSMNRGYPPMVVWYVRHPPLLLDEHDTPRVPWTVDPRLLESARQLGQFVDFLVITSNGTHTFKNQIEQAAGRKVLSMLDATLGEVRRRSWTRVGLLGFGAPVVYERPMREAGIAYETIEPALRQRLDAGIWKVMEGREDEQSIAAARDAIAALRARDVDGIVVGCTEIPFLLRGQMSAPDLVDPLELLALAAVRFAME